MSETTPDSVTVAQVLRAFRTDPKRLALLIAEALPTSAVDELNRALSRFVIFKKVGTTDEARAAAPLQH